MNDLGDHLAAAQAYRRALDGAGVRDRTPGVRDVIHSLRTRVEQAADRI